MKTYNHAYTIAFEVSGSTSEDGEDVTDGRLVEALLARIESVKRDGEVEAATGCPYDTYEEE